MKKTVSLLSMLLLLIFMMNNTIVRADDKTEVEDFNLLTSSGAWCWFADPRAIYYKGEKEQTYFSWVSNEGDIVIASFNHDTNEYIEKVLHAKFEIDDHDVPAILIRDDGRLIVFYSTHQAAGPMRRLISTNPEDITSWGTSVTWGSNVSYPNPFQMGDSICLFYRGLNWHPTMVASVNNGVSFGNQKQVILGGGDRPYARYSQSADGSVHIAVTTGHPRNEAQNKIYYVRLKDNKFYRADGTYIKDFDTGIDLDNNEAEVVYDGISNGRGWIWDLTVDPETQYPVMVYASMPTETDHRYNYAYWNGEEWVNSEIVKAGKWFPQTTPGTTEKEPHYSGGISMDYNDPSIVYLSKQVNDVFEIFKYTTPDKGETWEATAITANTPSDLVNVRPIVPRNHKEGYFDVLWMRGTYKYYYQQYETSIVFQMKEKTNDIEKIQLDKSAMEVVIGNSQSLSVSFFPIIVGDKTIVWTSSNESVATVVDGAVTGLSTGTSLITATAINGVKAACLVTVVEPTYLTEAFFDFGTPTSPLASGAIRISEETLFLNSYGWLGTVLSRDRSTSDSELRDFNMSAVASTPATFKVLLENGDYAVTTIQGDATYRHDNMQIKINGVVKASNITNAIGQYITTGMEAKITDNVMEVEFSDQGGSDANWVINSMRIEPIINAIEDVLPEDYFNHPETQVKVYDVAGKLVLDIKSWMGVSYLKEQLRPGIYIASLQLFNEIKKIKFII